MTIWDEFCDTLKRAGQQVLRPEAPTDPLTRVEGFRYLTRLLRGALESCVEFGDPRYPVFYSLSHETLKIGADNPDNLYLNAKVDGRFEYRIRGTRGTVHYLALSTKAGNYAKTGGLAPTGFIDSHTLQVERDGTLVITVSVKPHAENWLPMTPESEMVIVRQTFLDRAKERRAELTIERVPLGDPPEPLASAALEERLTNAARFIEGTARIFADWAQDFAARPNELPPQDQSRYQAAGGDPTIYYYHGYWALDAEQALVIEVPRLPECDSWNFQLNNYWMESLDYRYQRIHVNKHTATYASDGSCTIVVAHRDPGVPNWVTTAGHAVGTMCFRWIGAREIVHPRVHVTTLGKS